MRYTKIITFLLLICITLNGCNTVDQSEKSKNRFDKKEKIITEEGFSISGYKGNLESERIAMREYGKKYAAEAKDTQSKSYSKLDLSDCRYGEFPQADTVSVLREDLESDISADEEWPTVMDQIKKCKSGNGFFVNTNQYAVQILGGGIYSMSDGSITRFLQKKSKASMDALGVYSDNIVTGGAVQTFGNQSYKLFDRDTTVKDAAKMVQVYFNKKMSDHNVTTDIPQVEIFSLKDKYGYDFFVRRKYKGVNFAFADYGGRNVYGEYEIVEDMKHAYVVNNKTVSAYAGQNQDMRLNVLMEDRKIIGLNGILQILDKKMAQHLRLKIDTAEFVYCPIHFNIGKNKKESIIFPFWQLDGININNEQSMRIYADALTGEIYLYTYYI